jgi:hypothetical protein
MRDYWSSLLSRSILPEFLGSMHERLLVITAVQVDPTRGRTGALEARVDLHSWAVGTVKEV